MRADKRHSHSQAVYNHRPAILYRKLRDQGKLVDSSPTPLPMEKFGVVGGDN
jgi:hypothetical protein